MKFIQYIQDLAESALKQLRPALAEAQQANPIIETTANASSSELTLSFQQHFQEIIFWGFASATLIGIIFFVSITRRLEEWLDPILYKIKKFAPFIMQITLGTTLLASALYEVLFTSGLQIESVFGDMSGVIQALLAISGMMLIMGILPRLIGFIVVFLFIGSFMDHGFQVISEITHFGEALTISIFGGAYQIMQSNFNPLPEIRRSLQLHLHKYKFLLLRIFLGISLIYSAIYSFYLHGVSMLEILSQNNIVTLLSLDPTLILIGALVIEIALGIFFILGFEIRFAAISYLVFSLASIIFFQQPIWSQIIIIGTCFAMFTHGYDRYTIGGRFFKRGNLEPIL